MYIFATAHNAAVMSPHPVLYEINTRVWIERFGAQARLLDVPDDYWSELAQIGIDAVWLMGVWRTVDAAVLHYALEPGLQREYSHALSDWTESDIIGSPYAIDRYDLDPRLGEPGDLTILKRRLNGLGLRLILDFVPNHFHAESSLIDDYPEVFLQARAEDRHRDIHTFYASDSHPHRILAHGKDPYFAAWQDTVQVDYSRPAARSFMREQVLHLADCCDGLRCDMAMLPLNAIFRRTWAGLAATDEQEEFWPATIAAVKARHPNFWFMAEVYWDLEWELQQQGFDFTYDKRLLDRLLNDSADDVRLHLLAEESFQRRSVRFLENHDEHRILHELDTRRAQAAAIVTYTVPGMRFFYQGQWEGRRVRLPVQLGREPSEYPCVCPVNAALARYRIHNLPDFTPVCHCSAAFYERLLTLLREPTLRRGQWQQIQAAISSGTATARRQVLAWEWEGDGEVFVILVNYHPKSVFARLSLPSGEWQEYFTGATYSIDASELAISLYPWQYLVLHHRIDTPPA